MGQKGTIGKNWHQIKLNTCSDDETAAREVNCLQSYFWSTRTIHISALLFFGKKQKVGREKSSVSQMDDHLLTCVERYILRVSIRKNIFTRNCLTFSKVACLIFPSSCITRQVISGAAWWLKRRQLYLYFKRKKITTTTTTNQFHQNYTSSCLWVWHSSIYVQLVALKQKPLFVLTPSPL